MLEKSAKSYESIGKPSKFGDACTKSRTGKCNCEIKGGEGMANYKSAQSSGKIGGVATKSI